MKNFSKVLGIIALAAVIGFSMVSCSGGGGGDGGPKYTSVKSTGGTGGIDVYELNIGSKEGDSYTLIIYLLASDATKVSTGKITAVDGDVYNLGTFRVTITGKQLLEITGAIPIDGGGIQTAPGPVSPVTKGGDKKLDGTYVKGGETVKFSGSSFSYTSDEGKFPGTALYDDTSLVTRGSYRGETWVVGGTYTIKADGTINFKGFNTSGYNGDWVKQ